MRNVYYVRGFLAFDWLVCMDPGGMGSRKSQMSMLVVLLYVALDS